MERFQVIVLGVQGINNKIYGPTTIVDGKEVPTIVTEAHFPEGNALKLEKEGKLKRLSTPKEEKAHEKDAEKEPVKEVKNFKKA